MIPISCLNHQYRFGQAWSLLEAVPKTARLIVHLDNDFILVRKHTGPMVPCVQELMGSTSIEQRTGFLSRLSERHTGTMYIYILLQANFQL